MLSFGLAVAATFEQAEIFARLWDWDCGPRR